MRTRQGETICLGEWNCSASAFFPPAGGVWGGMRAGFAPAFLLRNSGRTKILNTLYQNCLGHFFCYVLSKSKGDAPSASASGISAMATRA